MQPADNNANNAHAGRLLDHLPEAGSAGFGAAMLRLAQRAAAQHRMRVATESALPWKGLTGLDFNLMDKAGQGSQAEPRSARDHGPVATEGDR